MNPKIEFPNQSWTQLKTFIAICSGWLLCFAAMDSPAQTYTVLHTFTGGDGTHPHASLLLSGTTLFGTTGSGGTSNEGTVFKINTDGSGFQVLRNFEGGDDGAGPVASLILSGTTLYGTTGGGGPGLGGTVFKLNTDGTGYSVIKSFAYFSEAFWPDGGLVLSGNTLYGTTECGGPGWSYGAVFKVNVDGTGFAVLHQLGSNDGTNPEAGLILSSNTLYGTTSGYANMLGGTVFKLTTNGTDFQVLVAINRNGPGSGHSLYSPVTLAGTTLYGTASEHTSYGQVFKINTDGTGYTVIKSITNSWGAWQGPGLSGPLLFGTRLYATTSGSWDPEFGDFMTNSFGTVFQLNTDGSGFRELKQFGGGSDGAMPQANVVLGGATLYGTTCYGGFSNNGVVFSLTLPADPPVVTNMSPSRTAEVGTAVAFAVKATGFLPLDFQWFFNDTNAVSEATTNSSLTLTNVQFTQSGSYVVAVSCIFGAMTSAPVMLNVIPPVDRRPVPALHLKGDAGSSFNVEYADALGSPANWLPLDTVTLTSTSQLCFDLAVPLPPHRFYRVWQMGAPAIAPSLNLPAMIPAITLTGNIGDQLRLDYINAIGPTNAWVNLDTVTLTNTSQLYFDISAPGQPRRLYRIGPAP